MLASEIIDTVGTLLTGFVSWFPQVLDAVFNNAIGMIALGLGVLGFVISQAYRLVGKIKGGKKKGRR